MKFKLFIFCCFVLFACSSSSDSSSERISDNQQNQIAEPDTTSSQKLVVEITTENDLKFEMIHNIEQGIFCLPYPSAYMNALPEAETECRGQQIFMSNNKKGKMILQVLGTDTTIDTIYKYKLESIPIDYPNSEIALHVCKANFFVISWAQNNRIYYIKKWYTKNKDIVMAFFEYDKSEQEIFDVIINKVTTSNPEECK